MGGGRLGLVFGGIVTAGMKPGTPPGGKSEIIAQSAAIPL